MIKGSKIDGDMAKLKINKITFRNFIFGVSFSEFHFGVFDFQNYHLLIATSWDVKTYHAGSPVNKITSKSKLSEQIRFSKKCFNQNQRPHVNIFGKKFWEYDLSNRKAPRRIKEVSFALEHISVMWWCLQVWKVFLSYILLKFMLWIKSLLTIDHAWSHASDMLA